MDENSTKHPEANPPEDKQSSEILDELRNLGENLRNLLQSAWESDERKKLQNEIETGLNDLHTNLSQAVKDFSESPTGEDLKSDLEDLGQRIRTGELETKIRSEVISALRAANAGLTNKTQNTSTNEDEPET